MSADNNSKTDKPSIVELVNQFRKLIASSQPGPWKFADETEYTLLSSEPNDHTGYGVLYVVHSGPGREAQTHRRLMLLTRNYILELCDEIDRLNERLNKTRPIKLNEHTDK
jgi:hypothetical protein